MPCLRRRRITGRRSFVISNSFSNQILAQMDLWANKDKCTPGVYILPRKLDEEVAHLHLGKIGVKLSKLSKDQADYLGVHLDSPYKNGRKIVNAMTLEEIKGTDLEEFLNKVRSMVEN